MHTSWPPPEHPAIEYAPPQSEYPHPLWHEGYQPFPAAAELVARAPFAGPQPRGVGELTAQHSPLWWAYSLLSTAGCVLGAYHGYKRNDSVGWAIGWALLGGLFPFIVIPVAFAQGIGKPARA